MIIDDNLILLDNIPISQAVTGPAVGLTSLQNPGSAEPLPLAMHLTEAAEGGTSLGVEIQQADKAEGPFNTVNSVQFALAALNSKKRLMRFLPFEVDKPWIRLKITPSGSFTKGKIFAAMVREDEIGG